MSPEPPRVEARGAHAPPAVERRLWHALELDAVESLLETGPDGLSQSAVEDRLARYGKNEIVEPPPTPRWLLFLRQFRSPLIYILLAATALTLYLGDSQDAAVIGVVLLLNAAVGYTQERRAESSVRALKRLVALRTRVVRQRGEEVVESRHLVPGDLVLLESGTRAPADLRLFSAKDLRVDESLLTGESVPVFKSIDAVGESAPIHERSDMVHAGTVIAGGRGRGYVVATGFDTELGAVAGGIQRAARTETPLENRMKRFAKQISVAVALLSLLVLVAGLARGEDLLHMFMVTVALAVAAIPEALPAVFTVTLAIGVQRMAKRNAVVRTLTAVETLGSTTVIGTDKTGTLTENRITVVDVWLAGAILDVSGAGGRRPDLRENSVLALALTTGVLSNEAYVRRTSSGIEYQGDPTEAALLAAAARLGIDPEVARRQHALVAELAFESERQYSASIRMDGGEWTSYVKGAPERVVSMCDRMARSTNGEIGAVEMNAASVLRAVREMADHGRRVLALAYRPKLDRKNAEAQLARPSGLTLLGLIGMIDPPRVGVTEAIARCQEAGIRVLMMTGDHASTAVAIGRELGIARESPSVLVGSDLDAIGDESLAKRLRDVSILARVSPEHKLRVVRALERSGEVVAVTGDGVNDAAALKEADIGIAMGRAGTDVAREASDIVLSDDNFASIHAAVEEGRTTFENLRKVTFFLLCTSAAEILCVMSSQVLGWPLPFLPAQLLWLNLVTNSIQDLALAFEPGDPAALVRAPRRRGEGILSRLLWERMMIAGAVMSVGTLSLFRWELEATGSLPRAQTVALTTMVIFQMFQVGMARSEHVSAFRIPPFSNPYLFIATAAAMAIHIGVLYVPFARELLRMEPVGLDAWVRMVFVALAIVPAMEIHKLLRKESREARA